MLFYALRKGHNKLADDVLNLIRSKSRIFNQEGFTPLTFTIHLGLPNEPNSDLLEAFKLLLHRKASPDECDETVERNAPLHYAVQMNLQELVNLLIERKVNPNIRNKEHFTPLHFASKEGILEIASSLVNNNARVNPKTNRKWIPLHFAASKGSFEIMKLLLEKDPIFNFLSFLI